MPFNASGTFVRLFNWTNDKNAHIPITASRFDGEDDDFATGLSKCMLRDGTGLPSGPINFNNQRITNVAAPVSLSDAMNVQAFISDVGVWCGNGGGTGNAQTATTGIAWTALHPGDRIDYMPINANTGAATMNVDALGAQPIKLLGNALVGGELVVGVIAHLQWDGASWQLSGGTGGGGGGISEAPNDGKPYSRQSLGWVNNPSYVGVTDGSNAAAGRVGEVMSQTVSGVAVPHNTETVITSLSLTAGDWEVWGSGVPSASNSGMQIGIAIGAGAVDTVYGEGCQNVQANVTVLQTGVIRVSVNAPTTVYLKAILNY